MITNIIKIIIHSMEIIKKNIELNDDIISLLEPDALFFDIESTGLAKERCGIYLIGCLTLSPQPEITLFFAEDLSEEGEVIREFKKLLESHSHIYTFNGEAFDIPFTTFRAAKLDIPLDFKDKHSFDIYKTIRKYKSLLSITKASQKALEEFMGVYREDKYDGGQLIEVYKEYGFTQDPDLKEMLLLHNYEDVLGMTTILPLISYSRIKLEDIVIDKIDDRDPLLIVFSATLPYRLPKTVMLRQPGFIAKATGNTVSGTIEATQGEYKLFHKNFKDYIYLPEEDIIVPKVLGSQIPKTRKSPCKKENCYSKDTGIFLKIPTDNNFKSLFNLSDFHLFRENFPDKRRFIKVGKKAVDLAILMNLIPALIYLSFS